MSAKAPSRQGMHALVEAFDWSRTPLGPRDAWPSYVHSAIAMILDSRFPLWIGWGDEMTMVYNDGFAEILEAKHPWALGRPALEVWSEVAHDIGPMLRGVLKTGAATWSDDQLLMLERKGFPEESYFTWSYSPVRDGRGAIAGILTVVTETTLRVVGERRLKTLRELGAREADQTRSPEAACATAAAVLSKNPHDIPFALIYLPDERAGTFRLSGQAGVPVGHEGAPALLGQEGAKEAWRAPAEPTLVTNLDALFPPLPGGPWNVPSTTALLVPLGPSSGKASAGFLVAGLSPRRPLDADYRAFLELVAGHIGTAIANARAFETAQRRAEALAELDRAKTTFFSNVSHEFRTPLTLLLGPMDALLAGERGLLSPEQVVDLEMMQRNGHRLQKLVNTLLDFSRIEAGRMEATFEPTRLDELTRDIASTFRSAIEAAGLTFTLDCAPMEGEVLVDRDMWEKIVLNLLSNAFKFTFEGGITVRLRDEGDHVRLTVADTGIGIPAEELPHLFRRFHRVQNARSRSHEGTGIGLALIQDLARLHGGEIRVASEPGRGSAFSVEMPKLLAPASSPTLSARPATKRVQPTVREAYLDARIAKGQDAAVASRDATTPPGETVLIADDNPDMREYLARIAGARWNVLTAPDGQAALALAREHHPDIVVTDVMMPVMDGFELLRAIRADPQLRSTPIIVLSARAGEEAAVEGLEQGADDYLAKPFSASELVARIASTMRLRRMREETTTRIAGMLEAIPEMCTVISRQGVITYQNKAARDALRETYGIQGMLGERWDGRDLGIGGSRVLAEIRRILDGGPSVTFEEFYPHVETWVDVTIHPLLEGVVVYARDITGRKRADAELAAARAELAQSEKLSALGTLVGGVAHELRTPLTFLSNNAFLAARRLDEAARRGASAAEARQSTEAHLREITAGVDRINQLVEDLRRYTKARHSPELAKAPLNKIVSTAVDLFRATARRSHVIQTRLRATSPIRANRGAIQQVTLNLLQNAVEATPESGVVRVETGDEGDHVVLTVADNGLGIDKAVRDAMFEPLFTTKPNGTGLGLSIVRRIVQEHGARITCESEPGKGATFRVLFPRA